jgi:hypothetical protein
VPDAHASFASPRCGRDPHDSICSTHDYRPNFFFRFVWFREPLDFHGNHYRRRIHLESLLNDQRLDAQFNTRNSQFRVNHTRFNCQQGKRRVNFEKDEFRRY